MPSKGHFDRGQRDKPIANFVAANVTHTPGEFHIAKISAMTPARSENTPLPFAEYSATPITQPDPDRRAALRQIHRGLLTDGLRRQHAYMRSGVGLDALRVWLSHRDSPTVDWLAERVGPSDLRLDVPPIGYYDQLRAVPWTEPPEGVGSNATQFGVDCAAAAGLTLEPRVAYFDDHLLIAVPARPVIWGTTAFGPPRRNRVLVKLRESRNGRRLVVAENLSQVSDEDPRDQ